MLDRQLPFTTPVERGWALLLRNELDNLLEEPEAALAEVDRARRAFGKDPAGLFAVRVRELERLVRRFDPEVPDLVAELERDYTPSLSEEERVRWFTARFNYEISRENRHGARRLLEEALRQAQNGRLRTNVLNTQAWIALNENSWATAEKCVAEIQALWPQGPPPLVALRLLSLQAGLAERRDQFLVARTLALASLTLARSTHVAREEVSALRQLQTLDERQGRTQAAREHWNAQLSLARRVRSPWLRSERLVLLVAPGYPLPEVERRLAACWPKLTVEQRVSMKLLLGESLMRYQADHRRGAEIVAEALAERTAQSPGRAVEVEIQGHMQLARASRGTESLQEYARAYALRQAHPLRDPNWARGLCRSSQIAIYYANALMSVGRHADAVRVCRETCDLRLSDDDRTILLSTALNAAKLGAPEAFPWAIAELERGLPLASPWVASYALKEFVSALPAPELTPARLARFREHYRELLDKLAEVGTPTEAVTARLGQATVLDRLGDKAAQLQAIEQARETARKAGLTRPLHDSLRELLNYYSNNRRWEEGLALAREVLADPGAEPVHDSALRVGAYAYERLEKPAEALEWVLRRDRLLRSQNRVAQADGNLDWLARLSEKLKLDEQAFAYWEAVRQTAPTSGKRALALVRQARLRKSPELATRGLEEGFQCDAAPILAEAVQTYLALHPEQDSGPLTLRALERVSQLPLADEGRSPLLFNETSRLVKAGRTEEAVRLLQRYPSGPLARLLASSSYLREVPELQPFLRAPAARSPGAERPLGALLDELRMARPELGNLLTLRSTNIAALQARLAPHQLLVGYYPVGEELYLIGLAREATYQQRVAVGAARLRELVTGLHLDDPAQKGGDNGLAQLLVEPLEPWLEGKTELLTVPTGDVWRVPLAALRLRNGKYLGERMVLSQLSSGDLLRLADGSYQPYKLGPALAVGGPPDVDLPAAQRELQAVPHAEVRAGLTPDPWKLIHIATHARFVPKDPMQSYLQLAGQRLTLKQIHELKLAPGCLVALSACESGLGQEHAGSEPVSLATAFSGAGAQAVVSGLWRVDDEATELLFSSLYAALKAGRSPGEALQEAQNATRGRYPHPYYWAAFSLLGWPD